MSGEDTDPVPAPTMDLAALLALPTPVEPRDAPAAVEQRAEPTSSTQQVPAPERSSRRTSQGQDPARRTRAPSRRPATPETSAATGGKKSATEPDGPPVRLYTAEQAAALLQIPASWLRKKAAAHEIAHTRIGRHLRFSTTDLQTLIAAGQQKPPPRRQG